MGTTNRHAYADTSLGELLLVSDGEALRGLYFPGHWHPPVAGTLGERVGERDDAVLAATATQLHEYLAGARVAFDLPVRAAGDTFSEQVWAMLTEIPHGGTTTYGALAEQLGDRHLAQRVGQAVGHNPVSVVIPCHRVVGAGGALTGYAGGLERKRRLLELEEPAEVAGARLF